MAMRTGSPLGHMAAATSQNSILGTWVKAIGRALDAAGLDGPTLLEQAGFNLAAMDGPDTRCPLEHAGRLWRLALQATGDEAFGVKLAKYYKHTTFHALGFGISASSTLKEALERVQRYSHVVSDAVEYQFVRRGNEYHLLIVPTTEVPVESIDALVGMLIRTCRVGLGPNHSPLSVELRRPQPKALAEFEREWRAPLTFNAKQDRLRFDRTSIERVLDSGNPELARLCDEMCARYLARIDRYNLEARVREILMQRPHRDEPSQQEIADLLNVSVRTLQRKLSENGTTFNVVWDETRHALALAYLSVPHHSVNEITHLLGFSRSSSFTRSFRRWTGLSPSDWRERSASRYLRSHQQSLADHHARNISKES